MQTRSVKTAEDAAELIAERAIDNVKVGVFDVDGIMTDRPQVLKELLIERGEWR